jgi:hypothetical protein
LGFHALFLRHPSNLTTYNTLFFMNLLEHFSNPPLFAQVLVAAFLAILFLQSGLDKVTDWSGNLGWLKGHFANSPLRNFVPAMLGTILMLEVAAGVLSAMGAVGLLLGQGPGIALLGAQLSATCIVMLFFGQRMAKDYPGAATLANYFILTIFAVLLLS